MGESSAINAPTKIKTPFFDYKTIQTTFEYETESFKNLSTPNVDERTEQDRFILRRSDWEKSWLVFNRHRLYTHAAN
jgi:hypothetical protein